jgi:hypothetical protein
MTTEDKDLDNIKVQEELDGGAVVELPDHLATNNDDDDDDNKDEGRAEGGAAGDDGEDVDQPNDTEAIRAARRARRKAKKEYIKQTNAEKDVRLQNLLRQNQELVERLSVVERKTNSADLARMDKAIEDQELRLQYAKMKMAEATSASDGDALSKAQDMWYDTRRQVENLKAMKDAAVKPTPAPSDDNRELQRQASKWMDRNTWYSPQGDDEDSEIAKIIDQKLVKEGWNPNQSEYWDELDRRLQKRLPHRYTDDTDERPTRSRPRSVVTSSGRENPASAGGRSTSFTLSPEQVRAMKDAGFWDDKAKRAKMVKRYAMEARNNSY